jgi:hypothetical protein
VTPEIVGGGGVETVTVALFVALPPEPVQVIVYVVVIGSAPVANVPDVDRFAAHNPEPSVAVHPVAFVELHAIFDEPVM